MIKVDWVKAKELRDSYWQIRQIAAYFDVRPATISAGFKRRGIK